MKMVMISAYDYEKLSNAKKESETKIESYKQCIAGYESRIKELTEERDKLKDQYRGAVAKRVLNSAYGVEQDICCKISNSLKASMFDKITELPNENEKLKKELAEKSEWLKAKNEALDNLIIAHNKLEKEHKELKGSTVSLDCHKKLIEDNERLADENRKLEAKVSSLRTQLKDINYAFDEKEKLISAIENDNYMRGLIIEGDANKITELRQKYEAVLKANEKLAAENACLANNSEITKLNNELMALKKQYRDLNNAYMSQKNTLYKLTKSSDDTNDVLRSQYSCLLKDYERVKLARTEAIKEIKSLNARLSQVAINVAKIYNNTKIDTHTLDTLVEDLKAYI